MNVNKEIKAATENAKNFSFWKIVSKSLMFIICITLLGGLIGIIYSAIKVEPVYTATASVMYYEAPDNGDDYYDDDDTYLGISMTKNSLKTMSEIITMPKTVQKANQLLSESGRSGSLSSKKIDVFYNENSCIFYVSYSDNNIYSAKIKLSYLLDSIDQVFEEDNLVTGNAEFIMTSSNFSIDVENRSYQFILMGLAGGLLIAVTLALIIYKLDNKIKSSEELEELSGVGNLSVIFRCD